MPVVRMGYWDITRPLVMHPDSTTDRFDDNLRPLIKDQIYEMISALFATVATGLHWTTPLWQRCNKDFS